MTSHPRLFSLVLALFLPSLALAQIADPIPQPIAKGSLHLQLQPIASGLTSPLGMATAPGNPNRLFVADQNGQIRIIENNSLLPAAFLNLSSRLVSLNSGYDERGLLGLAFDPGFANPASPGYRKLYTYTSEPVSGSGDFTVPMPPNTNFNHQSVVAEWTVDSSNANVVDVGSRREIMRIDQPQSNHNGGALNFGPDGYLYIALGDGGNSNDVGNGHTATIGNAQDLSNVLGSILRIDVRGNNSANTRYGIPASNPLLNTAGAVPEIYAYGLRNPYRFSFDRSNGQLIAGDVGQNKIEEINIITAGGNYGWHYKEGTFRFNPANGELSTDLSGLPAGLIDPVAQYDHDEGTAIVAGFVYRGSLLPQLQGKYVFGDLSDGLSSANGRLYYADLITGQIQEFVLDPIDNPLGKFIKGFGEDLNGELYLLASSAVGPSGSGGVVYAIVPEPASSLMALILLGGLSCRRR